MEFILLFFGLIGYGIYLAFKPYLEAVEKEKQFNRRREKELRVYSSQIQKIRDDIENIRDGLKERHKKILSNLFSEDILSEEIHELRELLSHSNSELVDELDGTSENFESALESSELNMKEILSMFNDALDTFNEFLENADEEVGETDFEDDEFVNYHFFNQQELGIAAPRTPTEILGIRDGFTQTELKQAYLDLVKRLHPDKWADRPLDVQAMMTNELKDVNQAYNILKDKNRT